MDQPKPKATLGDNYYPLRDQVRDELRARIADGRLPPGQRLIEQTLATEFGVSRVPVREALRSLETEGLVTTLRRKGVVVAELSREDVEHLYVVRRVLEALTFRLAASQATSKEVGHISWLVDQSGLAASTGDHHNVVRLNNQFHHDVTRMARNPFLISALEPLTSRLQWIIGHGYEYERDISEHNAMVEAIASHDSERAELLALLHVEASRLHALENFDRQQWKEQRSGTTHLN